jgi:hypothetical protein
VIAVELRYKNVNLASEEGARSADRQRQNGFDPHGRSYQGVLSSSFCRTAASAKPFRFIELPVLAGLCL